MLVTALQCLYSHMHWKPVYNKCRRSGAHVDVELAACPQRPTSQTVTILSHVPISGTCAWP